MPVDPLNNIMSGLLQKGAIDPANKQRRMADATTMRQSQGIPVPGVSPQKQPPRRSQVGTPMGPEQAPMQDPMNPSMIDVVIDQLNEAIVTLKVEIGRTGEAGQKRNLEQQISKLRNQVREMGGNPVEANESVDEGLAKLRGYGYVGREDLVDARAAMPGVAPQVTPAAPVAPTSTTTGQLTDAQLYGLFGQGAPDYSTQAGATAGAANDARLASDPAFVQSEIARAQNAIRNRQLTGQDTSQQEAYLQRLLGMGQTEPILNELMNIGTEKTADRSAGQLPSVTYPDAPPRSDITGMVNDVLKQWGAAPMTNEELYEIAQLSAERAALGQKQLIQRELDRFERTFPNEYAKAQERINEQAQMMQAEMQEDFAARGMYYSSIMGKGMTAINAQTLDLISEIASAAAERVAGLRDELRDVEQWEVLEREVLFHQLRADQRGEGIAVAQMLANVQIEMDQMALSQWQTQVTAALTQRTNDLNELKFELDRADRSQELMAYATLAQSNSSLREALTRTGQMEKFLAASPEEQGVMGLAMWEFMRYENDILNDSVQRNLWAAQAQLYKAEAANVGQAGVGEEGYDEIEASTNYDLGIKLLNELDALDPKTADEAKVSQLTADVLRAIKNSGPFASSMAHRLDIVLRKFEPAVTSPTPTSPKGRDMPLMVKHPTKDVYVPKWWFDAWHFIRSVGTQAGESTETSTVKD